MEKYLYKSNNSKDGYNLWMAYPAEESFAMASLGYLWLFKIADEMPKINAKRIYTNNMDSCMINPDSIAFSLSFDFDFMGVFQILEKYKFPFLSKNRDESFPLLFAGGPVITTNPEPYKKIFDFLVIGDGENVFKQVLQILEQKNEKIKTLEKLALIDGVYVPNINKRVKKITEELNSVIYTPILSDASYFKDTFIIEVSRGCMNRCAFCTASYLNLPYRTYDYENIIKAIDLGLNNTNKIALLGAQISAHPDFDKIINYLKNKILSGENLELGISSLRTDSITPELIQTLVLGGQKHSTIAIEAASDRLRKLINKNLSEDQILSAVKICKENGLKGLKIYSMIGIPTETFDDIEEFIILAKKIKSQNKGFEITFSFSSFVPKPQTPFQWEKRESSNSLEKKQKYLEKNLAKIGINSKFSSIKWDYWQSLLSRGDENLTDFLIEVYNNGGKNGAYKTAYKKLVESQLNAIKGFDLDSNLPWDIVENCLSKQLLINERNRLFKKYSNL